MNNWVASGGEATKRFGTNQVLYIILIFKIIYELKVASHLFGVAVATPDDPLDSHMLTTTLSPNGS